LTGFFLHGKAGYTDDKDGAKMPKMHVLMLTKDQDVMESIHQYLMDKKWKGAVIVAAVGSLYDVFVANPGSREFPPTLCPCKVDKPCEVLSFMGEITRKDDPNFIAPDHAKNSPSDYVVHIHMSFSHDEGIVNGGGFRSAKVFYILHIYMLEFD
jgi:predicted DNA-binding protein with PD1-like motif